MMPTVITRASALVCAHQGTVVLSPTQQKLTVHGEAVLVMGDLEGKPIAGCTVVPAPGIKPCLTVVTMLAGASTRLTVDGKPVLLDTATGLTDGVPPSAWTVRTSGQTSMMSD
jgi:hypothetical protein